MAEVDYQMALLLEYKFEQEKSCLSDLQLAKSLQEQYEKEYAVERPVQNLVYEKINQNSSKNPTKSLTDPSWEVIDPTPDIHNLFMAFNERFFWNKLLAVCVSWSKRMTSCAGICSYDGRGGMCRITLSEPLLKLRPRKDLVETLLHEMIHAYLFVTHNNRDRDGHGPEFHKHMYRINAESGTNITVYHNFFDEVRLYKQHWWRCNGPCQKWKPFFGMVRRAMNRPPGPNDKWWGKHSMDCGGSFIKVKEPEKNVKTVSTAKSGSDKTKQDIRNFIPLVGKKLADTSANNTPTTSNNNTKISNVIPKSNIFGFNDLNGSTKATKTNSSGNGFKGSVRNNSSTVIINKKPSSSTKDVEIINSKQPDPPPSTSQPPKVRSHDDYSVVRNHWTNKFPVKSATKRSFDDTDSTRIPSEKLPKLSQPTIECPICSKKISEEHLNSHIDDCLLEDNPRVCIICEKNVPLRDYQDHVNKCSEDIFKDDVFVEATENVPECWKKTKKKKICDSDEDKKQCEVCNQRISINDYPIHLNECFHKMYDDIEAKYSEGEVKKEMIDCLACGNKILKSELNSHLEDCLSISGIFDDENEPAAPENDGKVAKYNCPCCTKLFELEEMSNHIEGCLCTIDLC